jgi:NitT/TauT family transport system substrate-binding protein
MAEQKSRALIWILAVAIIMALAVGSYFWLSQEQPERYTGPVEKVTIAEAGQPIGALLYVAFENGYFTNEGLDITLKPHTSGRDSLNSVLEGRADLATTAETPIVHTMLAGETSYTIATIGTSETNMAVVARKDRGISTPSDFKGKKFGATSRTNGAFFLHTILILNGISTDDVEIVNLRPEATFDALVESEVDAVSAWNPHLVRLQKELGDKAVSFYGDGIYIWTWNIVARKIFVTEKPETILKIVRALVKAEEFIRENPDEAQNIVAHYLKINRALLSELWGIYNFKIALGQFLLVAFEDQARWAIKNNLTDKTEVPNYLNYIYFDALEAVKPEACTIIH